MHDTIFCLIYFPPQLGRAAAAFRSGALLKAPKVLKQRMPVSDKVIKVVAGEKSTPFFADIVFLSDLSLSL